MPILVIIKQLVTKPMETTHVTFRLSGPAVDTEATIAVHHPIGRTNTNIVNHAKRLLKKKVAMRDMAWKDTAITITGLRRGA